VVRERLDADMRVTLCGLGEPVLNHNTPSSSGASGGRFPLLSRFEWLLARRATGSGQALLDAGLPEIDINAGEEGEDYEEIYKLPFERTCENILRFVEMADDRCKVQTVLVDHRGDKKHDPKMMEFWRERGSRIS
jgi:hypothetical protein